MSKSQFLNSSKIYKYSLVHFLYNMEQLSSEQINKGTNMAMKAVLDYEKNPFICINNSTFLRMSLFSEFVTFLDKWDEIENTNRYGPKVMYFKNSGLFLGKNSDSLMKENSFTLGLEIPVNSKGYFFLHGEVKNESLIESARLEGIIIGLGSPTLNSTGIPIHIKNIDAQNIKLALNKFVNVSHEVYKILSLENGLRLRSH